MVILVLLWLLFIMKEVTPERGGVVLIQIFGQVGALWFCRVFIVLSIGVIIWIMWVDAKSDALIARVAAQRSMLDRSIRRDDSR